jgi:hypothetical protein
MKEAYVDFDTAKLLKEKGFDWPCICYYEDNGIIHKALDYVRQNDGDDDDNDECLCPTQQMACRWLREEKGIHISADIYKDSSNDADGNVVNEWTYWAWTFYWLPSGNIGDEEGYDQFDSYEDAVEAALEYVLKNLI